MPPFPPDQRPMWTPPSFLRQGAPSLPPNTPNFPGTGPIIDVTPTAVEVNDPLVVPPKPTIDQIPIQQYSRVVPGKIIEYKLTPQRIIPIAKVMHMEWDFDEPVDDDDNEVRVFVSISEEERTIIRRYGYHREAIEKQVPLFGDLDLTNLAKAHDQEIQSSDPFIHAFLRMEHKQQLAWAQEIKFDLTIIDYLASPFRRQCPDRLSATLAERDINSKLMGFKKKIDAHRV